MVDVDDFIQEILVEMEAEKIECTGKVVFSLIMGVIAWHHAKDKMNSAENLKE